ncbi:MAG: hypothetical protein ACR2OB_12015 [Solirubrobacteraceae bacterium]
MDKAGAPYIDHVTRVANLVTTPDEKIVAALHDVVEDTPMSIADLKQAGCPRRIWTAVDALTRRGDEDYDAYIHRLAANGLAQRVKAADLFDNLNEERLSRLPSADATALRAKYARAVEILGAGPQISAWRAARDLKDACFRAVMGDGDAMREVMSQAQADATFGCAVCANTAARLVLAGDHLLSVGFVCDVWFCLSQTSAGEPGELANALRARDLARLRALNPDFVPFWCRRCDACYCRDHWGEKVPFHDSTYGICRAGHLQQLDGN